MTSEKKVGPTPNGGEYSIIYYMDEDNNIVDKEKATKARGCEFDKDDNMICETWLVLKKDKDK